MKICRITVKSITVLLATIFLALFASLIYVNNSVSDSYLINSGDTLKINSVIPLRASYCSDEVSEKYDENSSDYHILR